jgi:SAM-dependent methyltransferase
MDDQVQALVAEQIAYYRAHAADYDVAYVGNDDWDRCVEELPVAGDVLELACGTGHWTPLLAARARSVTAVDAAPEVLVLARQRARGLPVEFIQTDVFAWQPPRRYDTVFFAFWLTHVPPGPVRQLLVDGRDGPDTGRAGLLRRRQRPRKRGRTFCARPGETGGLAPAWATAASTGWSRSTTRRVSLRPGWPSWAGRQTSARPAPRCLSGPLEGPATSSLDTMEWAPGWQ